MPITSKNFTPQTLQEVKKDLSLLPIFLGKGEPVNGIQLITTDDYLIKRVTVTVSNFSLDVEVTVRVSYNNGIISLTITPPGNWAKWEGEVNATKNSSLVIYVSYPPSSNPPQNMYVLIDLERQK